jgi:molybdopterin-guanine dinucleotide biosynthesis protein A
MPSGTRSRKLAPTVGVLLAGGASRRMGSDKSSLLFGERPMALRPAEALGQLTDTLVQIGGEAVPGLGWTVLEDLRPGLGPAAGLETALASFPGAAVVICGVDLPFVSAALLRHALERLDGRVAAAPRFEGRWHALAAAYSPALLPALTSWLDAGRRDLQGLLDEVGAVAIEGRELERFGDPAVLLANVNTPAELRAAEARLRPRTS